MLITVIKEKCTGCEICVSVCPFAAIEIQEGKAFITEACQLCRACLSACPVGAIVEIKDKEESSQLSSASGEISCQLSDYKGVWVFAEQRKGEIVSVAYELLGAGRQLANELNTELSAVLFGASKKDAEELIKWGADKVYHAASFVFIQ